MTKQPSSKPKSKRPAGRLYRIRVVGMSEKEIARIGKLERLMAQMGERLDRLEEDLNEPFKA